ncbi:MAG: zinc ribbon domain-containing protein [Chloroflexi bacterium]|nr:zinc ribbon domain-containing protein [Chloroflexota bacterium]
MPVYEYKCPGCGNQFDLLRRMSQADEPVTCPSCNNGAQRVLSVFASFTTSDSGSMVPVAGAGVT